MPKVVDWDARRDEVLAATWRVIARHGLAGTTVRKIAREAGYSAGVLAHYFSGKQDILGSALVLSHRRVGERMARSAAGLAGLAARLRRAAAAPGSYPYRVTQNPDVSRGRPPVPGAGTHAARGGSKFREKAWLLLCLPVGLTTWAAFLYIGIRARRRRWLAWAAV